MLAKISGIDLIAKEVKYHYICRKSYIQRAQRFPENKILNPKSQTHTLAFKELTSNISDTLIDSDGAELLTSLHERYLTSLGSTDSEYSAQST